MTTCALANVEQERLGRLLHRLTVVALLALIAWLAYRLGKLRERGELRFNHRLRVGDRVTIAVNGGARLTGDVTFKGNGWTRIDLNERSASRVNMTRIGLMDTEFELVSLFFSDGEAAV